MPELDGVEATRRISADHPSSRVLVLDLVLRPDPDPRRALGGRRRLPPQARRAGRHRRRDQSRPQRRIPARSEGGTGARRVAAGRQEQPAAHRSGARGAAARPRRARQQADRTAAGHHRTDGEGPPDERLPATRCHGSHAGRTVGERAPPSDRSDDATRRQSSPDPDPEPSDDPDPEPPDDPDPEPPIPSRRTGSGSRAGPATRAVVGIGTGCRHRGRRWWWERRTQSTTALRDPSCRRRRRRRRPCDPRSSCSTVRDVGGRRFLGHDGGWERARGTCSSCWWSGS